jgi:hypothetical protein
MGIDYAHYLIPRDNLVRPDPDRIVRLIEAWLAQGFTLPSQDAPARREDQYNARTGAVCARKDFGPPAPQSFSKPWRVPGFLRLLSGAAGWRLGAPRRDLWKPFLFPPAGQLFETLANPTAVIRWDARPDATYPMQTIAQHCETPSPTISIEISEDFINLRTDLYGSNDGPAKQIIGVCGCGHNLAYQDGDEWFNGNRIRRICPACGLAFRPQDQIAELVDAASGNRIPQPGGLCYRFAISLDFGREIPDYIRGENAELLACEPRVTDLFMNTCADALGVELNEFSYYC